MRPASSVALTSMPDDVMAHIFKRLRCEDVMPVCKTFRDLYRRVATTVTLARAYVPGVDDPLVDAMRLSPSLLHVSVSPNFPWALDDDGRWAFACWPTGRLSNVRTLCVPAGWEVRHIPVTLQRVSVFSIDAGELGGEDLRWLRALEDRLLEASSACAVHVSSVYAHADLHWLDFPPAKLSVTAFRSDDAVALQRGAASAGALGLESLVGWRCPGLEDLAHLRCASCLTRLEMNYCMHVTSLQALDGERAPSLASLSIEGGSLESLRSLHAAGLSALTALELRSLASLTSVELHHGMTRLRSLRLSDTPPPTLSLLRHLSRLEHVELGSMELSSLGGLAHESLSSLHLDLLPLTSLQTLSFGGLPRLQALKLQRCHLLDDLRGLAGGQVVAHLRSIQLENCLGLATLLGLAGARFQGLTSLAILNSPNLTTLAGMEGARFGGLRVLRLSKCGIRSLLSLNRCRVSGLTRLDLSENDELTSLKQMPCLPALRELSLLSCHELNGYRPPRTRLPALTMLIQPLDVW